MDLAEYGLVESDLALLKQKLDEGTLIIQTNSRTSTGVITSYAPASGKTFYFYKATIFPTAPQGGASTEYGTNLVEIRNDSTVKEYLGTSTQQTSINNPYGSINKLQSTIFDKLVGNGSKTYDLNITALTAVGGVTVTIYGTIIGWIEDT